MERTEFAEQFNARGEAIGSCHSRGTGLEIRCERPELRS